MVKLYVTYHAKEGCREQFVREVLQNDIINTVRREDGCLKYEYYLSLEDVNKIILEEEWTNPTTQHIHVEQPHMELLRSIKAKYIESTDFEEYQVEK